MVLQCIKQDFSTKTIFENPLLSIELSCARKSFKRLLLLLVIICVRKSVIKIQKKIVILQTPLFIYEILSSNDCTGFLNDIRGCSNVFFP